MRHIQDHSQGFQGADDLGRNGRDPGDGDHEADDGEDVAETRRFVGRGCGYEEGYEQDQADEEADESGF